MSKVINIGYGVVFSIIFLFLLLISIENMWPTKRQVQKYIVENHDRIIKSPEKGFGGKDYYVLTYMGYYFEEITISDVTDNGYRVIMWGDRNNKLGWFIWGDFDYEVDLKYDKHKKKKNIGKDEEVIRILKSIE